MLRIVWLSLLGSALEAMVGVLLEALSLPVSELVTFPKDSEAIILNAEYSVIPSVAAGNKSP